MPRTGNLLLFVFFMGNPWTCSLGDTETSLGYAEIQLDRNIPYKKYGDDHQLLADVYLPKHPGPYPTVLMIHGGAWFAGSKGHVALHARHAALRGYAVVAINYRLAPIHKFPAQLEDCEAALAWIRSDKHEYSFQKDCLATYGYSAGAQLACLVGLRPRAEMEKNPIKAIVAGGTPCEFSWIPADRRTLAYWLGGSREQLPEIYREASPISFVSKGDPPVHLFHGDADRVVPIRSPQKMQQALQTESVEVHLHVLPQRGHMRTFLDDASREQAVAFLDQKLKTKPSAVPPQAPHARSR